MCFTQAVPWNYLRVDVEILTEIQDLDADAEKASGAVAPGFEPQVININTPKGQDINMTICIIPGSQHHHKNGGFF